MSSPANIPGFRYDAATKRYYRENKAAAGTEHAEVNAKRQKREAPAGPRWASIPALPRLSRHLELSPATSLTSKLNQARRAFIRSQLSAANSTVVALPDMDTDGTHQRDAAIDSFDISDGPRAFIVTFCKSFRSVARCYFVWDKIFPDLRKPISLGAIVHLAQVEVDDVQLKKVPSGSIYLFTGSKSVMLTCGFCDQERIISPEEVVSSNIAVRKGAVWCASASEDVKVLVGTERRGFLVANVGLPEKRMYLDTSSDVLACSLQQNAAFLGCRNGSLRIFDTRIDSKAQQAISGFQHPGSAVSRVLFTNQSNRVFTAAMNGQLLLWDRRRLTSPYMRYKGLVSESLSKTGVAVNPTGSMVAAKGQDGVVLAWDTDTGELLARVGTASELTLRRTTTLRWRGNDVSDGLLSQGLWTNEGNHLVYYRM